MNKRPLIVDLYCLNYNECDPSKCTALKLKRFGLIKFRQKIAGKLRNAILLSPFAQREISISDKEILTNYGLIIVDCSWNKLIKFSKISHRNERKLPSLIAANPVNYGKWEKLSSVEALSAALYLTGFKEQAKFILSKFRWGNQFWKINNQLLEVKSY